MKHGLNRILVALIAAGAVATAGAQMVTPPSKTTGSTAQTAGTRATPNETGESWDAETFYTTAGNDGAAEVALGKLAQEKASSPEVREFATMMVDDHSKANGRLQGIGKSVGVDVPTTPDATKQAEADALAKESGSAFDRAYVMKMVQAHQDAIALFEGAAASGDPRTRELAKETLPKLREHAQHAQELKTKLQ